jgi:hypothetical protein
MILVAIVTVAVVAISVALQYFFSFFRILFTKPIPPKGAVEIDAEEHIYAHPDFTDQLQDPSSLDVKTVYDTLLHGLKLGPDRPLFSYRQESDQPFKSYTYK